MRISIATDHTAYEFKQKLIPFLKSKGHYIIDCGCESQQSCDYPDYGSLALDILIKKKVERAILCCSNGIGMSILANKMNDIFAAIVYSESSAADTRKHHNSNVLCLGAKEFSTKKLIKFTNIWLKTQFQGERHLRRINKIKSLIK